MLRCDETHVGLSLGRTGSQAKLSEHTYLAIDSQLKGCS